jgi:hypothetical protein
MCSAQHVFVYVQPGLRLSFVCGLLPSFPVCAISMYAAAVVSWPKLHAGNRASHTAAAVAVLLMVLHCMLLQQ